MKKNTYIDSLIKELNTHLWQAYENERENYHSITAKLINTGQAVNYKSVYLKDFFEFYIQELEFTPGQFISALQNENKLIEVLFSNYTSFIEDRNEFHNVFMPTIKKDIRLFTKCLKYCLDTHHSFYQNELDEELSAQIERNTNDFKKLLEIGQEENLFHNIPVNVLYTKNSQYTRLMQEKNILTKEGFSEKKLIELFNDFKQDTKRQSTTKIFEYCMFYIKDIVEKFGSSEAFNSWASIHINNQLNKDGKETIVMQDVQFFDLITQKFNQESQPYQDKLIEQWTDNFSFREKLSLTNSNKFNFLKNHPHKIVDYLDKLTDSEKLSLINKGINDCNFESSNNDFRGFILRMPLHLAPPLHQSEIIEKIIDFRKLIHNSEDVMTDNAFFSSALNFLVNKSLKSIREFSDEENTQAKIKILNVYAQNSDIIVGLIHNSENAIDSNVKSLETNLNELRLYKRELNLSPQFFDDLNSTANNKLETYYLKQSDNSEYYYMTNLVLGLRNCALVASALGNYSILDKINILDIKINKQIRDPQTKKNKTLYDYPAIFDILERNEDKGLIDWVLQEKHLPLLKETVTYKNKNIVEYFSIYEKIHHYGKFPIVEKLFEAMLDNRDMFKELVLSSKKTMKVVKELQSDFVQKSLEVGTLESVLKAKTEEPVKKVSRKI
jgi:hypothetical protein